ncbi:MAG TPA: FAD:protein FMN transferase [Microlunatus sp.]
MIDGHQRIVEHSMGMQWPQERQDAVVRMVDHVMGMPISVALRGPDAATASGEEAWTAVMNELRAIDAVFSTYRADSVINRFSRGELRLHECPVEVAEVLALGGRAASESDGAFSIWLPGSDGTVRLDPSGVVKGWAVERAARHLDALASTDYCLSAGGDITCRVADPSRPAWLIGIEDPRQPNRIFSTVSVRRGAVATSAATHRGNHIVDARTGLIPIGVSSVTVIGPSLTAVDIDATAAYCQGLDAAAWLRGRPDHTGLVVWADGASSVIS